MKTLFTLLCAVATWGYASAQNTDYSEKLKQSKGTMSDTSASEFIIKAMKSSAMEIEAGRLAQQRAQNADVKAYGGRMIADHTKASNELRPIALKKQVDLSMINQNAMGSGANNSGTNVQSGAATTTGTTANTATGNNQATSSAGTTTNSGTTRNTSAGNDQSTRSAGTTAPTGNTSSTTNASGNVNSTRNAGNTARTSNNVNYDSNTHPGKAGVDTGKNASHQEKLNLLKQKSGAGFDREYMQMMVDDHTNAVKMFEKASDHTDTEVRSFAAKNLPVLREHLTSAQKILSSLSNTNQSGNNN